MDMDKHWDKKYNPDGSPKLREIRCDCGFRYAVEERVLMEYTALKLTCPKCASEMIQTMRQNALRKWL